MNLRFRFTIIGVYAILDDTYNDKYTVCPLSHRKLYITKQIVISYKSGSNEGRGKTIVSIGSVASFGGCIFCVCVRLLIKNVIL